MPMHRSMAVANKFVGMAKRDGVAVTQMKLQKLSFLSNGWNWVVNGKQLISDAPEAWRYGPVYPDLYDYTKLFGSSPIERGITPDDNDSLYFFDVLSSKAKPFEAELTGREQEVIQQVWDRYKHLSAFKLSDLTHKQGTPWFKSYHTHGDKSVISQAEIADHYHQIVERAGAAA